MGTPPYKILSGGRRPRKNKKEHRCTLPGMFETFFSQTYTVIECSKCDKQWILTYTASMVDDGRCWERYDNNREYWRKAFDLRLGEYPLDRKRVDGKPV